MIIVITTTEIKGNHKYIKFNMLIQDADCCAAFATYPPAAKSKPERADPIPPPTLTSIRRNQV